MFGLLELVNNMWLRNASVNGIVILRIDVEEEVWRKYICEREQDVGRKAWKDGFNDREKESTM